ncbi:MAG TPA: glutamate formimidoyltransferase [bacterium]|nr:glutamate formimidoyltransferase [bacterium]
MPGRNKAPTPLVECVPNVSEGRRAGVIARLAGAAGAGAGARLLDVSSDADHNRTVLTFAGAPEAVYEAACRVAAAAVAEIDLTRHEGVHPRIGAVDVVPFVPLHRATMAECVALAHRFAVYAAECLHLPVYLYAEAARRPEFRGLAAIRRGGFEGLRTAIRTAERRPDAGPAQVHPTAGAVAVGARGVLIAMNVDLAGVDVAVARSIARAVRESSGGLPAVQAMGMWLPRRGVAQVSMNLLDYHRTPPLAAFERVRDEAQRRGAGVAAGELIGCAPRDALPPDPVTALCLREFHPGQILDPARLAGEFDGAGPDGCP